MMNPTRAQVWSRLGRVAALVAVTAATLLLPVSRGVEEVTASTPPTMASLSPVTGPDYGGTAVTITGTNFVAGNTQVRFGGGAATNVQVDPSGAVVTATTPAYNGFGAVEVDVTTPNGMAVLQNGFTYQEPSIYGLNPVSGPTTGGTTVTITGTALLAVTSVTFWNVAGTNLSVNSTGAVLTVMTPPGSAGAADVRLISPQGMFDWGPQFTYVLSPTAMPTTTATPSPTATPTASASATPRASLVARPTTATIFDAETVTGTLFGATEPVKVYWDSTSSTALTSTTANRAGAFVARVAVPQTLDGSHQVVAVGQATGRSASSTVTVKPRLMRSPTSGAVGSAVSISGFGFKHETVTVIWDTPVLTLGTRMANSVGTFSGPTALTFTVPLSATAGQHTVTATGQTSHAVATAVFVVLTPASTLTATPTATASATLTPLPPSPSPR